MNFCLGSRITSFVALIIALMGQASAAGVLHFWAVTGSVEDVRMYQEVAKGFTAKTGIKVEVTPLAWGNFETKYFTGMAAGLPPDVGETNLGGPFNYGAVGGLVDLREEFPIESKVLEARFTPQLPRMFTIGNHLYGVPSNLSTPLLYYRTDIFKQLGLQAPRTWSELNRVIGKLEASGYRYYFGFPVYAQWALGLYTMPYGLAGVSRDASGQPVVNWNEPNYQKGVMQAMRLWYLHDSPGKDMGSRVLGLFRSNKPGEAVPLMIDVHSAYSGIHHDALELEGKWDVAPWPTADDGKPYSIMGGTSYVIFRKSKMKKEAMQWMQYLLSDEAQRQMTADHLHRKTDPGMVIPSPSSMWAASNDSFWNQPDMPNIGRLVEVLKQTVPTFATVPTLQGQVETGRTEQNLLDQMGTYIQDGLNDMAQKKGISRSELIRGFGAGKHSAEYAAFENQIAAKLKSSYAKVQPEALALVRSHEAHYQERYGDIIGKLPELEKQRNILDTVKAIALAMLVAGFLAVVGVPKYRKHYLSYLFVAPPVILAIVFVFVPAAVALYLSLTDYHPVLPLSTAEFVGTKNYSAVAHSGDLTNALLNTLKYAVISLPLGIGIALLFAYLLNYKLVGQRFWRFLYFSPLVTSVVSIALIFTQLFLGGKQGWLNAILLGIGAVKDPVPFLQSEHSFMNCVIVLAIWQGLAFTILVYLAGLQQISDQLYEAAEIDGAGPTRRFWHIALPGIRPQLFFTTVLGLIGSFQVFELIYTLAGKSGDAGARFGPNDSALTMVPLSYHMGFETFEMGKSAAVAYVLFAIILLLTAGQVAVYKRVEARS